MIKMNYCIRRAKTFFVIGQEIELTHSQRTNIQISTHFWQQFNLNIKRAGLSQTHYWTKFAFMQRRENQLFYYCAIPKKTVVPVGFKLKEIQESFYLVVEHVGSMNKIYNTYGKIYQELLPHLPYTPITSDFLHFEKYDARFHWNREDSIIEIWVPIQQIS